MEAVAALTDAGIPTGILIAPLMPGINDAPEQVERIIELAGEAGATSIGGITLHLRPGVREVFMDWLRGARPDLVERYERLTPLARMGTEDDFRGVVTWLASDASAYVTGQVVAVDGGWTAW